ncbi:alpha-amylase 4N-like [Spodoptera frugiperda]|uniref:Alpha-amylase n=1 Tax=Spodoptera frugiperda TaxID=7108 RepID=A0A9R0DZZ2_SPOFR|nr:alpha-amylase 4N-like [Spodoptera frugiperda]XP_050556338.1 alpha-amylase 4N-like [Spodoptera frugiperda]
MALLVWFCFCSLFGAALSCEAYIKTNQWPGRSVIVQMFEWKWLDIADECERFLGPKGFGAVQTSPASENLVIHLDGGIRPWYERYQVMSYNLVTRSGDAADFLNMTTRCNKVGVRVYVDVVFNHMTGDYATSVGTGGSTADTYTWSYPGVPYTEEHFHHPICDLQDYNNATEVRVCQLSGLKDLNQTMPYVRQKIIDYLNNLIDLGAAGIRVDAAKHMWPEDLNEIYRRLNNLNMNHGFRRNSRPYIYQEVSKDGTVKFEEYKDMGDVTEFTAGTELALIFSGQKPLKTLESWGTTALDMMPSDNAVIFVDNHDTQRNGFILTYKNETLYKTAIAFLLAHPYGQPRMTSSFYFTDFDQGPPADADENIISPVINEDQNTCSGGWVCEHRWAPVYRMVGFRNVVHNTAVSNWWDNGNNQIAFGLGNKGFIVFNTEGTELNREFQTGLPAGVYCDIISGQKEGSLCTGKNVTVSSTGAASITLSGAGEELHLAIHVGTESFMQTRY